MSLLVFGFGSRHAQRMIGFLASFLCASILVPLDAPPTLASENRMINLSGAWVRAGPGPLQETFDPPVNGGPGPITADPLHPHNNPNGNNGGWASDLTNPILKPATREALRKITEQELAGNAFIKSDAKCEPNGVPRIDALRETVQFLQTPKEITIVYQRDAQTRHVFMNVPHSKNPPRTWYGESVGHYEGDALIVDTIGMNDRTYIDRFGLTHSDLIHVVERLTLVNDRKLLRVEFTVEDPGAYTMPWSAKVDYRRDEAGIIGETVCAENNRSSGIPIPTAATPDF